MSLTRSRWWLKERAELPPLELQRRHKFEGAKTRGCGCGSGSDTKRDVPRGSDQIGRWYIATGKGLLEPRTRSEKRGAGADDAGSGVWRRSKR